MSIQFVAFDVETPNRCNDKICSIGLSIIEDTGIVDSKEYLVNPECDFDRFNVNLHGISPEAVKDAPAFPVLWEKIELLFSNCLVVAHNAKFDLCVLKKSLAFYNIPAPKIHYIDTLEMAQFFISEIENYKLPTLCNYFGHSLNHHNAGSDSDACANILLSMISLGVYAPDFIRTYDLAATPCAAKKERHARYSSDSTRSLNELNSILKAISCDNVLAAEEIDFLISWMNDNSSLRGNYPYDRIYDKLSAVLSDGIIDSQEAAELLELFKNADKPITRHECSCDCFSIENKNICLSGDFEYGTKDSVASRLISVGAQMQNNVTKKTDILIVGGQGSAAWSMGNYGTKIKKALELQEKGSPILIIGETDFFMMIGEKQWNSCH